MIDNYKDLNQSYGYGINLTTVLWVSILTFFIRYVMKWFQRDPRLEKFAKQLPGPYALPLVGNGFDFLRNMHGKMEIMKMYEEKYGPMYRLWFGKHLVVVVADLKHLEVVFSSSKLLNKPAFMDPAREFWGDSLLTSGMPLWKKTRKALQPLFVKSAFVNKFSLINAITQKYVKQIEKHANGIEFDIGKIFAMLAFDVVIEVVFNSSIEYKEKDLTALDDAMHEADSIFFQKMFKPWLRNPIVDYLKFRKFKDHFIKQTNEVCTQVLRNQRTPEMVPDSYDRVNSETKTTFIQTLFKIKTDCGVNDDYVKDEIINTIAEGTMTASTTLSFCVLMLAIHPDIQNKLYEEVNTHFEGTDREADENDVDRLSYLDQVLKETERRVPLVQTIFRDVNEDTTIGPYTFPAGTAIIVPFCTIHSNPRYFENPDKFDPEHFSPAAVEKRPKHAFLPFSTGARNCLGKALAELEMKLTLISLVRLFEFRTSTKMDDLDLQPGVSVKSRTGYRISLWKRKTPNRP